MLKKLDKGKWSARVVYRDRNGKRHEPYQANFRTKTAAQTWHDQTLAELKAADEAAAAEEAGVTKPVSSYTLADVHAAYLEHLGVKDSSPRTVDYYNSSLEMFFPLIGDVPVADLKPADIQAAVDASGVRKNGKRYRAATVRGFYRALRAELNYAVVLGALTSSPCLGILLPGEEPHEAVIYTGGQLNALLSSLREQAHPLYLPVSFCARFALRRGEALGVRWADLDLREGILHVRANLTVSKGRSYLKRAKTRSSETTVALGPDFAAELQAIARTRWEQGRYKCGGTDVIGVTPFADLDSREFVCLDAAGKVFRPDGMCKRLHTYQRANGLITSGWHDLRHTYGTLMAEEGVDLVTISKAMRHSGTAITAEQYISGTNKLKRKATDAMTAIIGG